MNSSLTRADRRWEGFTAIFTAPEEIDVPGMPVKPAADSPQKAELPGRAFAAVRSRSPPSKPAMPTNSTSPRTRSASWAYPQQSPYPA